MNMLAVKYLLTIGGAILMVDGIVSIMVFYSQPAFNQLVRLERAVFAILLIFVGVML